MKKYLVDRKRYNFVEINSADTQTYLVKEEDVNKWIKVNTTDNTVDIQLPDSMSEGFTCVIENTGELSVNYINSAGTNIATQQDPTTEVQYRTIEAIFNNGSWRLQGFLGRNDLSSLYDVNTKANPPLDQDVLTFNQSTNTWTAGRGIQFTPRDIEFNNFSLDDSDNGKTILVDTDNNPVDVAINTGLKAGFRTRIINIGEGTVSFTPAVSFNTPVNSLDRKYNYIDIFHQGLEMYYTTSNQSTLTKVVSSTPINPARVGETLFDASTNKLYIYNGASWVSTQLN